jgi:AraC family transcriptional regulator
LRQERSEPTFKSLYHGPSVHIADSVGYGHLGGSWHSTEHAHPTLQVTFLSRRSAMQAHWLTDNGFKCEKRILGSGICVTPAFQPHSIEFSEIHGTVMMSIATDLMESGPRTNHEWTGQGVYGESDPFLQHLGELLFVASSAGLPISRLHAESTAVIILEHLNQRQNYLGPRPVRGCGRLQQVVEFIHSNLENELSIIALARIAQTSPFHFARQFKASTGLTPHRYVLEQRIEMAKRLLTNSHLAIAEVAQGCGFATQAHLTTAFRRHVGATPKEFRAYLISTLSR